CFVRLYFLERACQAQIMALSAGEAVNNPPQGSPEITAQQGQVGVSLAANLLAWPALKRKAYRLDPSFATEAGSAILGSAACWNIARSYWPRDAMAMRFQLLMSAPARVR